MYDETKLYDIISWSAANLKPGLDPRTYALGMIAEDEEGGEEISLEIPGHHSRTGNPIASEFANPEA